MKQLILSIVFVLAASSATSQTNEDKFFYTRQNCSPAASMVQKLNQWGETPLFVGKGVQTDATGNLFDGATIFLVNQDTGTWSLISVYADGMACIVAVGVDFEPYTD